MTDETDYSMDDLLEATFELKASDLHLATGDPPLFRIGSDLLEHDYAYKRVLGKDASSLKVLHEHDAKELIESVLKDAHKEVLESRYEVDLSVQTTFARFRMNVGKERRGLYATIRLIPNEIRDVKDLGFPNDVWKDIIQLQQGLVLITGVTGSGKSTTLASMIQEINRNYHKKIICIEDPIEYVHRRDKSLIIQREVPTDTRTFFDGVKYSLRQDPDIILVGEIRDSETAKEALSAAETGHLVFSTLHTKDAVGTIARYVDLFPAEERDVARAALAENLSYVLSQQLIPYTKRTGRVLAMEVMTITDAIRAKIREGKTEQIQTDIQTGGSYKMISMDKHLDHLIKSGRVLLEDALQYRRTKDYK